MKIFKSSKKFKKNKLKKKRLEETQQECNRLVSQRTVLMQRIDGIVDNLINLRKV